MCSELLKRFWADECGSVLAMEYLMLGSIVAVGGVTGLVSMRDSMNNEMKEFGSSVREVRQAYTPAQFSKGANKPATYQMGDTEYVPLNNTTMVP
jgi:Flp pilus assembly pilin Flp